MRPHALASLVGVLAFALVALAQPGEPVPEGPASPPAPRPRAARLANAAEVRQRLGLVQDYENVPGVEAVKVAVLDYGFDGLDSGRAYLPDNAVVVEHYDPDFVRRFDLGSPDYRKGFEPGNRHGRTMAQIIWAMTGSHPNGPRFFLLNANGPTMLRRAVRYAVEQHVDVILFSGSYEGGGNGDGRGPINRIVADALAAGILWVNAAGNYGHHVYNGPVRIGSDGYLRFRDGPDGSVLRFRNRLDENTVTVTLTWNDYREEEDAGTTKDLDLYVEDPSGKVLASSEKRQVAGDHDTGPGESRNPRERVVLNDLPANLDFNYRIRVRARSNNFTTADRIRVLVSATRDSYVVPATGNSDEAVPFFDASRTEEIYPPADNPLVLTVGDSSPASSVGPTTDHRLKPDVIVQDSRAFFSDGEVTEGSSNAAALIAGVVTVLKAAEPGLRPRHLLSLARHETSVARDVETGGVPIQTASSSPVELLPPPYSSMPEPTPAPAPAGRLVVVGPRGRTYVLQVPSSSSRPTARPVTTSQPSAPRTALEELSALLERRVWQTPGRARLAELVRANR